MNASDKSRFGKTPLTQRRGIYLDHYPDSWLQFALRDASDADLLAERLKGISHVTIDVTQSVFDKTLAPPPGAWSLLIHLKAGSWSILPMRQQSPSVLYELGKRISGEYLCAAHSDSSGVYSIERYRDGKKVDSIFSDGDPWDEDDDEDWGDEDIDDDPLAKMLNGVESETYTTEWMAQQPDLYSAMHQILSDWNALIPDYWWDQENGLVACQKQLCGTRLIKRIDLIQFGEIDTNADLDASKRLFESIQNRSIEGVRNSLADGASLTQLPDTDMTAIEVLCRFLPAQDKHVIEIAELLIAAGADPDAHSIGRDDKNPLTRAISASAASPRMMFDLAKLLVQHGATVTASEDAGLDDSPLEAAFNRADAAWINWALQFDQPTEMLKKLLDNHHNSMENMGLLAGENYADEQRERYAPIVAIVEDAIAGNPPDGNNLEAMFDQREDEYRKQRAQFNRSGSKLVGAIERLAGTHATEEQDGQQVPVFDGFDVTENWISTVPRNLTLVSADHGDWGEDDEVKGWHQSLEKAAFKRVGAFRDEGGWIELIAYCQPFRDIYGVIEKIDHDLRLRLIRRLTADRYLITTNQKRIWNQAPAKTEVDWVTHRDAELLLGRPIIAAAEESESASADQFVEHYERAHWHLRRRLRDTAKPE